MASVCQKCRQAVPHESDSWCLGCSAAEALTAELRNTWGNPGSRALATDLVVSGLRQVRALRRLGLATAGGYRAAGGSATATGRETPRGSLPPPEPVVPPRSSVRSASVVPAPASAREVKQEVEGDEEEEESESESGEGEADSPPAGLSAKAKAEPPSPLPRRRSSGEKRPALVEETHGGRADSVVAPRESGHREVEEKPQEGDEKRRKGSPSRGLRPEGERVKERRDASRTRKKRSSGHGHHHHPGGDGAPRRRKRPHRAGSKHQRLYRAAEDPYRRFHQRRPEGYWDQEVRDFR